MAICSQHLSEHYSDLEQIWHMYPFIIYLVTGAIGKLITNASSLYTFTAEQVSHVYNGVLGWILTEALHICDMRDAIFIFFG